MLNAGTVQSFATLNDQGFKSGMKNLKKQGERFSRQMSQNFDRIGRSLTTRLTLPLGLAGGAMIKLASDAEETSAKFNTVFRDISKQANNSAKVLTDSFGLSQNAAKQLLGDTGDLLTGFGFTQDSALDLSEQVNKLAVDLASFTNFSGGAEGASQALTKALLGERESVKSLGISILETDVKAKILENTQKGLTFETERQAKAYATLQIAQEQSKNAIGDFARTQDSFANQSRQLKAEIEDLAVSLGNQLLPMATRVMGRTRDVVSSFSAMSDTSKTVGLAIAGIAFSAGPTLLMFSSLLKIVPKLIVSMKALTATMLANPYLAVGAAIAAIGTTAWLSSLRMKALREESERLLELDMDALSVEMLDRQIEALAKKIEGIDKASFTFFGHDFESKRLQELRLELSELIAKRNELKASSKDPIVDTEQVQETATEIERVAKAVERVKVAISKPTDTIFDPSDVVAAQLMRQEMDFFNNTLVWAATHTEDFSHRMEDFEDTAVKSTKNADMAMGSLANSIGGVIGQLISGKKEALSFGNILSAVAPAIINVLTGGAGGFLSNAASGLFGGLFHGGGMVPGSGDKMIRAKGGEMVLTPSQQKALSFSKPASNTKRIQLNIKGVMTGQGSELRAVINESTYIDLN